MSQRRRKYKPGSVISGTNYKVIRHIGSGAMGAVYEALHCELDKAFVIKVLHQDLVAHHDPVRRLRCEWQLLARLEHPNIVSVTDAGFTNDGVPYFVMERLEGETLYSRMNREPVWSVPSCVQLALELLEGLIEAHAKGIVHRDIKPSNIFLPRQCGAKLLDFGIAKLVNSNAAITAKGVTLGTPRYMAPEQACGQVADCRSDIYALGVILFELAAGEHPFSQAQTPVEMLIAQAGWDPPRLLLGRTTQNDEFVTLVGNLLSKNPKNRPATAVATRALFRGISSSLDSGKHRTESSIPERNDSGSAPRTGAPTTRKLAFARRILPSQHETKKCDNTNGHQGATVLGRRKFIVKRRYARQILLSALVAIAGLSVSNLATPFPIHRVLSAVWFGTSSSAAKFVKKSNHFAGPAAEQRTIHDAGLPGSLRATSGNDEARLEMRLAVAATGQPRPTVCVASPSAPPKKNDSGAAAEVVNHHPTRVLRPNEGTKEEIDPKRVQTRPSPEYESLTRR